MMDDAPVTFIRESTRNLLKWNRRMQRDEESDARRLVENKNSRISPELIADIANRLKSKSQVSTAELQLLKNVLIDDAKNISLVLGTQGALRGLVREMTGVDVKRQCAAAGCCCNLALGDSKACLTVAKAAGPYLVAALDSLTEELAVTCAWTLGNLCGAGGRAGAVLTAQGALASLAGRARGAGDAAQAAMYALLHMTHQLGDQLSVDHLEKIIEALFTQPISMTSSQLLFVLSCHKHFDQMELPEKYLQELLKATAVSTATHVSTCKQTRCCQLVYLFRALANFTISDKISSMILNYFATDNVFKSCFPKILMSDDRTLVESLLWMLGVVYKYCDQKEFFTLTIGVS